MWENAFLEGLTMSPITIAQVGVRGYGQTHLERIARLDELRRAQLVATADPGGPLEGSDLPWYPTLTELLEHCSPDIASLATPIGTHATLAAEAMRAGACVMLEKPPVASLDEFWELTEVERTTGRRVQVGFQSLGSGAIARMRALIADGTLGEISSYRARGAWLRARSYYARAAWAGRRTLDGHRVADGVVTNPLAHSIATALAIAGATRLDDIASITTEMYHAHDIEADDTSFVRVDLVGRPPICAALTLCAPEQLPPTVTIVGSRGTATFSYTTDEVWITVDGIDSYETFPRTELLENLVDHIERGTDLLVPLADTVGFMCVLEATQDRPGPLPIADAYVVWQGEGVDADPVVDEVERWMDAALAAGTGFAGVGAPWADPAAIHIWTPSPEARTRAAAAAGT